jgi:hypothetical protein
MASHNYYVFSFASIDTMRNTLRRPKLEHVETWGGNVALGDFVRVSQVIVCSPGTENNAPEDSKGQCDRSRFTIHAWFGHFLLYREDDGGAVSVNVNLYTMKSDIPYGVRLIGMAILPEGFLLVQTNLPCNLPIRNIIIVALLYHFQQSKHGHHGNLNVFAIQHKLECVEAVMLHVSVIGY